LRFPGAIGILAFVSPTIGAFFFWQGFVSVIAICALAFLTYHFLPKTERSGVFPSAPCMAYGIMQAE
jgi:hypothetical protein